MTKKKIAIVGAGNAACITALLFYKHANAPINDGFYDPEITIYYDPSIPIERVGQGNVLPISSLIFDTLGVTWKDNFIGATVKSGINYENWGQTNHDFFHFFSGSSIACHYTPNLLSQAVLQSGKFKVVEKNIQNPEDEIDADYIFDCRGRPKDYNEEEYESLSNPLNAAILSLKPGRDYDLNHTRCVATPDGWTFVIPNNDSLSYGYLYNDNITTKEEATKNFVEMFDVVPDGHVTFNNYVAKSIWSGERTILNGNRYSFIEPLEATSTWTYFKVADEVFDHITQGKPKVTCNDSCYLNVKQIERFLLWHYQRGSKFDTPFWDYAKTMKFPADKIFLLNLNEARRSSYLQTFSSGTPPYGCWDVMSFKNWADNVDVRYPIKQ